MTSRIKAPRKALFQALRLAGLLAGVAWGLVAMATAQSTDRSDGQTWVASWASSMHGPYPFGIASAQPVLDFALESAEHGARDQTLRQIIKPDLWGRTVRLHLANTFGTRAVIFGLTPASARIASSAQPAILSTRPPAAVRPCSRASIATS